MNRDRNEALILLGAAVIAICGMYLMKHYMPKHEREAVQTEYIFVSPDERTVEDYIAALPEPVPEPDPAAEYLAEQITKHYPHVTQQTAERIVELSFKYEHEDFPKADDIVAIIAIESSFIPTAQSSLAKDPAKGLMQIRHNMWSERIGSDDMSLMKNQIKHGAGILKEYYDTTGDKISAISAYNVGITNFRRGVRAPAYVSKYRNAFRKFGLQQLVVLNG